MGTLLDLIGRTPRGLVALLLAACAGPTSPVASHVEAVPPSAPVEAARPLVAPPASGPAPGAAEGAPPPEIRAAAERAAAELSKLGAVQVGSSMRRCDDAGCKWIFLVRPVDPSQRGVIVEVMVEEVSRRVTVQDSTQLPWMGTVAGYLEAHEHQAKLLDAVEKGVDVSRVCADVRRSEAAGCFVYVVRPGDRSCPAGVGRDDACLWEIYVGEPDHIATLYVDPTTFSIVAVSDATCVRMAPAIWRERYAQAQRGVPVADGCPP